MGGEYMAVREAKLYSDIPLALKTEPLINSRIEFLAVRKASQAIF